MYPIPIHIARASEVKRKYELGHKQWIEFKGKAIIGEGRAQLLAEIRNSSSILKAAEKLSIPYRTAWEYLKIIEDAIGCPVVNTHRGGPKGGGGTTLTAEGEEILREYERYKRHLDSVAQNEIDWEAVFTKISARNRIKGVVKGVEKGEIASTVRIEVAVPAVITAMITQEAVEELGLKEGDAVEAVIKATEILVSKE